MCKNFDCMCEVGRDKTQMTFSSASTNLIDLLDLIGTKCGNVQWV